MLLHDGCRIYNLIPDKIKNESRLQNFRRVVPFIRSRKGNHRSTQYYVRF